MTLILFVSHSGCFFRLKELHNEGYAIVIFSNQAGVSKKKQSASDLTGKIDDVVTATGGLPIAAYFAIDSDHYRKPCPGMWYQYLDHLRVLLPSWHHAAISQDAAGLVSLSDSNGDSNSNSNCAVPPALSSWVDTAASFFCGDAAGRTAPTAPTAHSKDWRKDHSDADRCFAGNAALPFVVPEQVLLPAGRVSAAGPAKGSWAVKAGAGAGVATAALADRAVIEQYARQNGAAVVASKEVVDRLIATGPGAATRSNSNAPGGDGDESKTSDGNDALEVVVMVGAPACGKSTIARALCALPAAYGHSGVAASADSVVGAAAYEWVNQDTLKTKEKCAAAVAAALKQGRNVVVDNTNPTAETRALYTRAAKMAAAAMYVSTPYLRTYSLQIYLILFNLMFLCYVISLLITFSLVSPCFFFPQRSPRAPALRVRGRAQGRGHAHALGARVRLRGRRAARAGHCR